MKPPSPTADQPARLRRVALPAEHGGWSLTLEPVLLGLLVEPGMSGLLLGVAALVAFLSRTPSKLAAVDRIRGRRLPRTSLAERVAAAELVVLAGLLAAAWALTEHPFGMPLLLASPLVVVAFSYDVRSRSRRLTPELAGTIGVASVAAAIALAGGGDRLVAYGLWTVAAARAVATIPFVRAQLHRAKGHQPRRAWVLGAQAAAVAAAGAGRAIGAIPTAGLMAIFVLAAVQAVLTTMPVPRVGVIGAQQVVLGLTVVLATGLGALAP